VLCVGGGGGGIEWYVRPEYGFLSVSGCLLQYFRVVNN
jgi:hypothetical protein